MRDCAPNRPPLKSGETQAAKKFEKEHRTVKTPARRSLSTNTIDIHALRGRAHRLGRLGLIGALLSLASACSSESESSTSAACVADEAGGCLASVRMTYLNVKADLTKPLFVNNRIPVEFGITATSPAETVTRNVAVGFTFVEANPQNGAEAIECGSSAFDLELVGDGNEKVFSGFIWPTTLCQQLVGKAVNLRVDFDGADEQSTGIDEPSVTFSEAARSNALNQQCRTGAGDIGRGCVYSFNLQATPTDASGTLIDVLYNDFSAASSVAVLPATDTSTAPTLSVETSLVVNGRDPYMSGVSPEDVPASLEASAPGVTADLQFGVLPSELGKLTAMPGRATVRYEIAPAGTNTGWRPLTIGSDGGHVSEAVIANLIPGTENVLSHELFADGDTRAALTGGEWANVSDFDVRGCFTSDFTQAGNNDEGSAGDCRTIQVVLVRETPNASAAASFSFDKEFSRNVGTSRIGLGASLTTQNRLDTSGAFSHIEGEIDIKGNIGKSFSITIARAVGEAALTRSTDDTGYEIAVDAFGDRIFSVSKRDQNMTNEKEFSSAKQFSFPNLGFGFGPVHVGIKLSLGGEVAFTTADVLSVSADPNHCQSVLTTTDGISLCGLMSRSVTPGFHFTASLEGGIDVKIAKAAVVADLDIVNTDFPFTTSLAWGVGDDGSMRALGNAHWELGMQLISGEVALVGRVGIRRFSKSLRVNLFSFSSPRFSQTLLDRSLALEVLK